jgi:hypothetical protein
MGVVVRGVNEFGGLHRHTEVSNPVLGGVGR